MDTGEKTITMITKTFSKNLRCLRKNPSVKDWEEVSLRVNRLIFMKEEEFIILLIGHHNTFPDDH